MGKTRLAIEFAHQHLAGTASSVCVYSDVAGVDGVESLQARLGAMLAIRTDRVPGLDELGAILAAQPGCLMLLDNFDGLAVAGSHFIESLLRRVPGLSLLVTSRSPLALSGERIFALEPLSLPGDAEDAARSESVALFVDRACLVRRDFDADQNRALIGEIVRRLDGLPLAIELAASRMRSIGPRQLLAELERGLYPLADVAAHGRERYQSLRVALDLSWSLLDSAEQKTLAECSVFVAGFSLSAATAVVELSGEASRQEVLDVVQSLCEKSLVTTSSLEHSPDELRYALLAPVRAYAVERLAESDNEGAAAERHATYFAVTAFEQWREHRERGSQKAQQWLEIELSNMLASHGHSVAYGEADSAAMDRALKVAIAIDGLFSLEGRAHRALDIMTETLGRAEACASRELLARAHCVRGHTHRLCGESDKAVRDFESCSRLLNDAGASLLVIEAENAHACLEIQQGRPEAARLRLRVASLAAEQTDSDHHRVMLLGNLAWCELELGHTSEAIELLRRTVALAERLGNARSAVIARCDLGQTLLDTGDIAAAEHVLEAALLAICVQGNTHVEGLILRDLGACAELTERWDEAERRYRSALELQSQAGERTQQAMTWCALAVLAGKRGDIVESTARYQEAADLVVVDDWLTEGYMAITASHLDVLGAQVTPQPMVDLDERARRSAVLRIRLRDLQRAQAQAALTAALRVAADGSWFDYRGELVDLRRSSGARRVLDSLTEARLAAPGQPVSVHVLFEKAWPGTSIALESAANRIYVAMSALRRLGLRDVILREARGYLLDPNVPTTRCGHANHPRT